MYVWSERFQHAGADRPPVSWEEIGLGDKKHSHCRNGHPLTPENRQLLHPELNMSMCRICLNSKRRLESKARKVAALADILAEVSRTYDTSEELARKLEPYVLMRRLTS